MRNKITVFTKSWPDMSVEQLADFLKELGVDGAELAVRAGYPVNPDNIARELPRAARIFHDRGLFIGSVAADTDEKTIAACGESGIPLIRVCVGIDLKIGYRATEENVRAQYDKLVPLLDKHGVAIGVQNHCDNMVGSAIGIMHLIEKYDARHVCAVLDPAHCAVSGEPVAMALDIVWSHLRLVNFKSAFRWRTNGPDEEEATWRTLWTTARHAGYSWRTMLACLRERGYSGDICLPSEYSEPHGHGQLMGDAATALLKTDISHIKKLLSEEAVQCR